MQTACSSFVENRFPGYVTKKSIKIYCGKIRAFERCENTNALEGNRNNGILFKVAKSNDLKDVRNLKTFRN